LSSTSINDVRKTVGLFRFFQRTRAAPAAEELGRKVSGKTHGDTAANNDLIAMDCNSPNFTDHKNVFGNDKRSDYNRKDCEHRRA